ncbi:ATP synthase, delta/epsilon subunit, beta-sandwich domain protein [Bacteroidales bacterium KA00344]|nr:ATP synthase, delta/epsilon subunit, beta-sandwich domain protein [Bacteroidales bacterium KA00344]
MLTLKIVSPEKIVYDGPCKRIKVPGTLGSFEILNNHAPIISSLETGIVEYVTETGKETLEIDGGFIEVCKNVVNLCVEV